MQSEKGYGAFYVGSVLVALPIDAVREVVPETPLSPWPSSCAALMGGLDLRGVKIPVIDLLRIGKGTLDKLDSSCIVVVRFQGKLLGILATRVVTLFTLSDMRQMQSIESNDAISGVFNGSVMCPDNQEIALIINTESVFQLPGLPLAIEQDHCFKSNLDEAAVSVATNQSASHLIIFQVYGHHAALRPMDVESTLAQVTVLKNDGACGFYAGDIEYRGQLIPACHLGELLGLGAVSPPSQPPQAIVVQVEQGPIALLVDRISDLCEVNDSNLTQVAQAGLDRFHLIKGLLDSHSIKKTGDKVHEMETLYVINMNAISQHPDLNSIAGVMRQANRERNAELTIQAVRSGETKKRMVTYRLGAEFASPIEQIDDLLRLHTNTLNHGKNGLLMGLIHNRSRAIFVVNFPELLGLSNETELIENPDHTFSVILVERFGRHIGFAGLQLLSIEDCSRQPIKPVLGSERFKPYRQSEGYSDVTQQLAQFESDDQTKMLEVLDLHRLADYFMVLQGISPLKPSLKDQELDSSNSQESNDIRGVDSLTLGGSNLATQNTSLKNEFV